MAVNLSPIWGAGAQLLDNSGNVLTGGKIYTYLAGTTTPAVTYTSSNGATANSNPIILNSAGRVPYEIWLTDSIEYKFVLKDSNDVLIGTWDNLVGINSNFINYYGQQEIQTATANQTVFTLTDFEYQPGTGNLSVFVDGVNQYGPGAQYAFVETNANTVTFVSGLHVGASVKFTTTKLENPNVADASQISYTYPDSNAVTESLEDRLAQYVSVKDFGAVGDGVTDDTVAIQNARDFIASNSTRYGLTFPSGIYLYSVSPNWAIDNLNVVADGEVKLRYTGTGNAVIFDGGSTNVYNVNFGAANNFIVEAPNTALNGVYTNKVNHCVFGFNVRGCGTNYAGLMINGTVCNKYNIVVSGNESGGAWYLNAKPKYGINLGTGSVAATQACYNLFNNAVIEGVDIGIRLYNTLGNVFVGGTSEGCSSYGVYGENNASWDRFYGMDYEVNTNADIYLYQGNGVEFNNCDSYTSSTFGVDTFNCRLLGGQYKSITFDTGSVSCTAANLTYDRFTDGGVITDGGSASEWMNIRAGVGKMYLTTATSYTPGTIPSNSTGVATVSLPGAKLGDFALASFSLSVSGFVLNANVTATDTVLVNFTNVSGAPITLGAGILRVRLLRGVNL